MQLKHWTFLVYICYRFDLHKGTSLLISNKAIIEYTYDSYNKGSWLPDTWQSYMYILEKTFLSCETCVLSNCLLNNTTQSYGLWQPVPVRYRTRETIFVLIGSYKEGKWKNACAVIACLSNTWSNYMLSISSFCNIHHITLIKISCYKYATLLLTSDRPRNQPMKMTLTNLNW
jgi:hypothetical protein